MGLVQNLDARGLSHPVSMLIAEAIANAGGLPTPIGADGTILISNGTTAEWGPVYAEGTFTPTIAIGGASTGITYTTQYGRWTQIGNRVLVDAGVLLSNKGALPGVVSIEGLPFTPAVNVPVVMSCTALPIGAGLVLLGETSGPAVYPLTLNPTSGVVATVANTQIVNTTSFKFSAQYTV